MTPYQVSSEIYGGFFYSGITLNFHWVCLQPQLAVLRDIDYVISQVANNET